MLIRTHATRIRNRVASWAIVAALKMVMVRARILVRVQERAARLSRLSINTFVQRISLLMRLFVRMAQLLAVVAQLQTTIKTVAQEEISAGGLHVLMALQLLVQPALLVLHLHVDTKVNYAAYLRAIAAMSARVVALRVGVCASNYGV